MPLPFWSNEACLHQHTKIDERGTETCLDCGEFVQQWCHFPSKATPAVFYDGEGNIIPTGRIMGLAEPSCHWATIDDLVDYDKEVRRLREEE